jgi:hypothetical protein
MSGRVAAELDAQPGVLERVLVTLGVRPGLVRRHHPSLRLGWLLANALVLGLVAVPLLVAADQLAIRRILGNLLDGDAAHSLGERRWCG